MSLYAEATGILIPSGYNKKRLYGENPAISEISGTELVVNGNFSASTGWTVSAPWTIGSGVASYDDASTNSMSRADGTITAGKYYRVSFGIVSATTAHLTLYNVASSVIFLANENYTTGSYIRYFKASVSSTGFALLGNTAGGAFTLDNLSIVEVSAVPFDFVVARNAFASRINVNQYIQNMLPNYPLLDYRGDTCPAILMQPARTRLNEYPTELGNSYYTKTRASIQVDASTAVSVYVSNFSAGVDSWTGVRGTLTGNIDGITGVDNTLRFYANTNNSSHFFISAIVPALSLTKIHRVTFDYYLPSAQTAVDGFYLCMGSSGFLKNLDSSAHDTIHSVTDTWTTVTVDLILPDGQIGIRQTSGGLGSFIGAGNVADDLTYIKNVVIQQIEAYESPMLGPNLDTEKVVNGGFATDTNWTKEPEWTISGGVAIATATTSSRNISQDVGLIVGKQYQVTFTVVSISSGSIRPIAGDSSVGTFVSTAGTFTQWITPLGNSKIYFDVLNGTTCRIDNVSVKEILPTYDTDTALMRKAWKLVEDTTATNNHYFTRTLTVTAGSVTHSVIAKKGERSWIALYDGTTGIQEGRYFDLNNGVLGAVKTNAPDDSRIVALGGGWYWCSITVTAPSTTANLFVLLAEADGDDSFTGNGTSGVYVFFPQVEEGAFPTTPIWDGDPIGTLTRVVDEINNAPYSGDSESGVLYFEAAGHVAGGSNRRISISDGTTNNRIFIGFESTTDMIRLYVDVGGVNVVDLNNTTFTTTDFNKIAVRWAVNDFSLWVNGTKILQDSSGAVFSANTLTEVSFDRGDAGDDFLGFCREVDTFEYLTNAQMQTLTYVTPAP